MVGLEEAFRCYPSPLQPPLTIIDSKLIRALDFALGVGARGGAGRGGAGARGRARRIERQLMMGERKVVGDDTQLSRRQKANLRESNVV